MTQIMAVLDALAEPAFFLKDGKVTRCNAACARLPLAVGDEVAVLAEALTQGQGPCHTAAAIAGQEWEVTLLPQDGEHLVLLKAQRRETGPLDLLNAAARGFQHPLTSVIAAGGTLFSLLEEIEDEELQDSAAAMSRGLFRILRNISAMTEYTRLQTSDDPLFLEKTHVKAFFDEQVLLWADMLQDGHITLEYHSPKKEFNGNLDRALVQRAVLGLIANAVTYGESGAPIVLGVSYLGGRMKITVKNQGKPMDPDIFATAFSRFDHASPLDDSRWGSGFGLPLAQTIARLHGGSVFLESGEGGTTVTMVLRLDLPESPGLRTPLFDPSHHYDPAYVELSGILPNSTYDSRNVDL